MRIPEMFEESVLFFDEGESAVLMDMEPATGEGWKLVPCDLSKQDQTEFCWAAVTQAVERMKGLVTTQCEIAQDALGNVCGTDCSGCNLPEPLADILKIRKRLRQRFTTPISFKQIQDEIDLNKQVICCAIERSPNNHFIIICGYSETTGSPRIAILDPSPKVASGPQSHGFNEFLVTYEEGGTWDETYFTQ